LFVKDLSKIGDECTEMLDNKFNEIAEKSEEYLKDIKEKGDVEESKICI
jgi:hypothetical protein